MLGSPDKTVEIFPQGTARRQSSARARNRPRPIRRSPEHMPSAHRRHAAWNRRARRRRPTPEKIGPSTAALVPKRSWPLVPTPRQGFRNLPWASSP